MRMWVTGAALVFCSFVLAGVLASAFSPSRALVVPIGAAVALVCAALVAADMRSWAPRRDALPKRVEAGLLAYVLFLLLVGFSFAVQGTYSWDEQTVWVPSGRIIAAYLTYPAIAAATSEPRPMPAGMSAESPAHVFSYEVKAYGPTWPHMLALAWLTLPFLTHVLPMLVYGLCTTAAVELLAVAVPAPSRPLFFLLGLGGALLAALNMYPSIPQSNFPAAGLATLFAALVVSAVVDARRSRGGEDGAPERPDRRWWRFVPSLALVGVLLYWSRPEAKVVIGFVVAPFLALGAAGLGGDLADRTGGPRSHAGALILARLGAVAGAVALLHAAFQSRVIGVGLSHSTNWLQRWFNEFPLSQMQLWGPKITTGLAVWVGDTDTWRDALARYASWSTWLQPHDPVAPVLVVLLFGAAVVAAVRGRHDRATDCLPALVACGSLIAAYATLFVLIVNTVNLPSLHRYEAVAMGPASVMAALAWTSATGARSLWADRRLTAFALVVLLVACGSGLWGAQAYANRQADKARSVALVQAVKAYYAAHGCYPRAFWVSEAGGFGVPPNGISRFVGGPWPADQVYGAFTSGAQVIDEWSSVHTASYVGVAARSAWEAKGRGATAGYVWAVENRPVPLCGRASAELDGPGESAAAPDMAKTYTLAAAVRAFYAARGCYPIMPRGSLPEGVGVAPDGVGPYLRGPWPADAIYEALVPGPAVASSGTASYVGVASKSRWQANLAGLPSGFVWIAFDRPVPLCRSAEEAAKELDRTRALAHAVASYRAVHGCYPATPWSSVGAGFGVAPAGFEHSASGSWPGDALYGAFDRGGSPVTTRGTAYYVGVTSRTAWRLHGGGNTNAGYVWLVDGAPAPVCQP